MKINSVTKVLLAFWALIAAFGPLSTNGAENGSSVNSLLANEPNTPASMLSGSLFSCNEVDLSWVSGDGSRRIVVASAINPVSSFPNDGSTYTAGSLFGVGANLGNNNFVVYNGSGNNVTVTGLNASNDYYFSVFEYNGTGSGTNYLISTYPSFDTIPYGLSIVINASATVICQGDTVFLQAHGANVYSWAPSTGLSSTVDTSIFALPNTTIRYTLTGTDTVTGCVATERVNITVNARPTVTLASFQSQCENGTPLTLTGGSPSGGTYSGNGVTGGIFYPAVAGPGVDSIHYSYTNAQGCSRSAVSSIQVYTPPAVTFSTPSTSCTNASSFLLVGGSPTGGTYSGTGVNAGRFYPSVAGTGAHTLLYVYTDGHGCSDSANSNITVYSPPNVTLSSFVNTCENSPSFTLSGGSPTGGLYSGTGVSGGVFNPSTAGPGVDTIRYTYYNAQGCSSTASSTITVYATPVVTFASLDSTCTNRAAFTLTSGSPSGGTYSGPGVSGGVFHPSVAGAGTHTIVYSYTNAQGCSSSASTSISVYSPTSVTFSSPGNKCLNAAPVTLTGGNPAGGVYSGPGVTSGVFHPATVGPGTDTITYTYTNSHGCISSTSTSITVLNTPTVNLGALSAVCSNVPSFTLTGGTPAGGVYIGSGVSAGHFDPSVSGSGTFNIIYSYTNGQGCSDSAFSSQVVHAAPVVSLSSWSSVCNNTPSFALSGGSPVGGIYTGPGITSNEFSPAVADTGLHMLTYTYTDSLGCMDSASATIIVYPVTLVSFLPLSSVCENYGPVTLNGGSPAGGVYSGTAVAGGKFYTGIAGAGTHPIVYTLTNSHNCVSSATQPIQVNPAPHVYIGVDTLICAGDHLTLDAGAGLTGYLWSTGATTSSIVVDTTSRGTGTFSFRVRVTNSFGCINRDTINVLFDICNGIQKGETEFPYFEIYPNPCRKNFMFVSQKPVELILYDLSGRMVMDHQYNSGSFLCGEELQPGIYIAEIRYQSIRQVFRLVKTE